VKELAGKFWTKEKKKDAVLDLQKKIIELMSLKDRIVRSKPKTEEEVIKKAGQITDIDREIVDINRTQIQIGFEFYGLKGISMGKQD
jgi:hypothetical protein